MFGHFYSIFTNLMPSAFRATLQIDPLDENK